MFRTDLLSIIRGPNIVYTAVGICHASFVDCLIANQLLTVKVFFLLEKSYFILSH